MAMAYLGRLWFKPFPSPSTSTLSPSARKPGATPFIPVFTVPLWCPRQPPQRPSHRGLPHPRLSLPSRRNPHPLPLRTQPPPSRHHPPPFNTPTHPPPISLPRRSPDSR